MATQKEAHQQRCLQESLCGDRLYEAKEAETNKTTMCYREHPLLPLRMPCDKAFINRAPLNMLSFTVLFISSLTSVCNLSEILKHVIKVNKSVFLMTKTE